MDQQRAILLAIKGGGGDVAVLFGSFGKYLDKLLHKETTICQANFSVELETAESGPEARLVRYSLVSLSADLLGIEM